MSTRTQRIEKLIEEAKKEALSQNPNIDIWDFEHMVYHYLTTLPHLDRFQIVFNVWFLQGKDNITTQETFNLATSAKALLIYIYP